MNQPVQDVAVLVAAIITAVAAILALVIPGASIYIKKTIRLAMQDLRVELSKDRTALMCELDQRYVRLHEYRREVSGVAKEESTYRGGMVGEVEGVKIRVDKIEDHLTITLENILGILKEDRPKRGKP